MIVTSTSSESLILSKNEGLDIRKDCVETSKRHFEGYLYILLLHKKTKLKIKTSYVTRVR